MRRIESGKLVCQRVRRVRNGCAGSQSGGDHCGFGDLSFRCTSVTGVAGVDLNAIGALRRERHGNGDQFLIFYRDRASGNGRFIKRPKGFGYLWGEFVQFFDPAQVFFVIHVRVFSAFLVSHGDDFQVLGGDLGGVKHRSGVVKGLKFHQIPPQRGLSSHVE